jgi:hypothetical protein
MTFAASTPLDVTSMSYSNWEPVGTAAAPVRLVAVTVVPSVPANRVRSPVEPATAWSSRKFDTLAAGIEPSVVDADTTRVSSPAALVRYGVPAASVTLLVDPIDNLQCASASTPGCTAPS